MSAPTLASAGPDPGTAAGGQRRLTIAIAAIAGIGVLLAGYLVYVHYAGLEPICQTGGCEKVQTSDQSMLVGIPVALLGLIGYILILGSLRVPGEAGRTATALLALVGFGFSAYLTYSEIWVIDAICQWCVGSAVLMTVLAVLSTIRLVRAPVDS